MPPRRKRVEESESEENEDLWDEEENEEEELYAEPKNKKLKTTLIDDILGNDTQNNINNAPAAVEEEVEEDPYDEDLYLGDDDRERLSKMSEMEREGILYEREEHRRRIAERRAATARALGSESASTSQKRRSTRSRAENKKDESLHALRNLFERRSGKITTKQSESFELEEGEYEEQNEVEDDAVTSKSARNKRRSGMRMATVEEDEDELEEGEVEVDEESMEEGEEVEDEEEKRKARFSIPGLQTAVNVDDLRSIQLRRTILERIFEEPYFPKMAVGMFVRASMGRNSKGENVYRFAEIKEVTEFKNKYKFGGKDTKMGFLLEYGKNQRIFPLTVASNHGVSIEEMESWKTQMLRDKLHVLSSEEAKQRHKESVYLKEHFEYTSEVVEEVLAKKGDRLRTSNLTVEKTRLFMKLEAARTEGDVKVQNEVQRRLDEIEEMEKSQQRKKSRYGVNITHINEKNREADMKKEALMFTMQKKESQSKDIKSEPRLDAFKRRATRPSTSWEDEEEKQQEEKPTVDTQILASAPTSLPSPITPAHVERSSIFSIPSEPSASDRALAYLHNANSVDLDIDINDVTSHYSQSVFVGQPCRWNTYQSGAQILSIGDYWARVEQEDGADM